MEVEEGSVDSLHVLVAADAVDMMDIRVEVDNENQETLGLLDLFGLQKKSCSRTEDIGMVAALMEEVAEASCYSSLILYHVV